MSDELNFEDVVSTGGDGVAAVFVRGHLASTEKFRTEASRYMKENFEEDIQEGPTVTKERWRTVPHPEFGTLFVKGTGRGSFPVTCVSFRKWER